MERSSAVSPSISSARFLIITTLAGAPLNNSAQLSPALGSLLNDNGVTAEARESVTWLRAWVALTATHQLRKQPDPCGDRSGARHTLISAPSVSPKHNSLPGNLRSPIGKYKFGKHRETSGFSLAQKRLSKGRFGWWPAGRRAWALAKTRRLKNTRLRVNDAGRVLTFGEDLEDADRPTAPTGKFTGKTKVGSARNT
jgi:hypothetical protein